MIDIRGILLSFLIICFNPAYSAITSTEKDEPVISAHAIKVKGHYGRIVPHHKGIEYFVSGSANSFEVNYAVRKAYEHQAQSIYRYPETGIGYSYNTFSNKKVFGSAHSLFPYISIPSIRKEGFFQHSMQIGFGLAYFTKKWDMEDNLQFFAIGSHMNAYFNISSDFQFQINKSVIFSTSLGITHFSNGNYRKPNLGMNVVNVSAGLQYVFNPVDFLHQSYDPADFKDLWEYVVIYSSGANGYSIYEPGPLWAQSLQFDMGRRFNPKRKLGFGVDVFHQESNALALSDKNPERKIKESDKMQTGIHLSYGLIYNRLELNIQMGTYLFAPYQMKPIYNRYAFRYAVSDSWIAQLSLKAHYGVADFVELGIGYRWLR